MGVDRLWPRTGSAPLVQVSGRELYLLVQAVPELRHAREVIGSFPDCVVLDAEQWDKALCRVTELN